MILYLTVPFINFFSDVSIISTSIYSKTTCLQSGRTPPKVPTPKHSFAVSGSLPQESHYTSMPDCNKFDSDMNSSLDGSESYLSSRVRKCLILINNPRAAPETLPSLLNMIKEWLKHIKLVQEILRSVRNGPTSRIRLTN